ncbi:hypothetical protein G6F57_008108 [Rhizopus arrhizus]|uniref:Arrestin C-terminal-like domain-containing protein n=1 Tax=Rhizopus oryzae TaxID=64495 RepID=A0A9P7BTI2_RHIOR|nr:hypothetical protein G6F21_001750 [Rhizopus arrhizus]KAG1395351.1 hypothetical protein G6F58_011945 [Rhizopus delemar]KAG0813016.1 hypothetical protein G6F20_005888 [Rhizopus arrhizus]KAG0831641.1 hypothetical protein G6F19_006630 [Rhizopus arrhizus]KAG0833717.1 hypothetical protein G6F18_006657 [Rhizopus arrhizus]
MPSEKEACSVSIELLPEFGWSIGGQPVYGPGSVFQGYVKVKCLENLPLESIRVAFYAVETIPPFDIHFGTLRTAKNTLFSVQLTLWDSKKNDTLSFDQDDGTTRLPFIIQMPMVQFPPSLSHTLYRCDFQLIAMVNTSSEIIKTERSVLCMPYVETHLLKTPMMISVNKSSLSAQLKMSATEFVPSDSISLSLHVGQLGTSKRTEYVTVQLKLIRTVTIKIFDDIPDDEKTVASALHKLLLIPTSSNGSYCDGDFTLQLPADLSPSCDYGNMVNISYRLQVKVEQKGPLGGIWNYTTAFEDIPVTIGTLGYGIRLSDEFNTYSQYKIGDNNRLVDVPVPKFMKTIEYEDALPLYDSVRLPDYDLITAITC